MSGTETGPVACESDGGIVFRRGREEDLLQTAVVFKAAINELYRRHSLPEVTAPEASLVPLHRHFLRSDAPRFWVAEADRRVVGFGAGLVRGALWYLAALFVLPEVQGRGVGGVLLRHARTGAPASGGSATIADALQPVSNTLYAHHGLLPWLPILGLTGRPSPVAEPRLPRGCSLVPLDATLLGDVRQIDERVTGLDRTPDHAYLLSGDGGRDGWLLRREGRPEGYLYVHPRGLVGPAASTRRGSMTLLMHCALAILTERGAESAYAAVPGPNAEAQRVLLDAGLVYEPGPGLLLASRPFGRFDRYVIANYGLM